MIHFIPLNFLKLVLVYSLFLFNCLQIKAESIETKELSKKDKECIKGMHYISESTATVPVSLIFLYANLIDKALYNTKPGMQYSLNSSNGADGTWTDCNSIFSTTYINFGNGGLDVWVRWRDTTSVYRNVCTVPAKAPASTFTIDYYNETTTEIVPANISYSDLSDLSSPRSGGDHKVQITPGSWIYFWIPATQTTLESQVQTLIVPGRPSTPTFTLDSLNFQTNENVNSTVEYSVNADMSNSIGGTGTKIAINLGQTLYFRTKATNNSFKSPVQSLHYPVMWPLNSSAFTGVSGSTLSLGDYNNDGTLDLLAAGDSIRMLDNSFIQSTKLYKNVNHSFVEQKNVKLEKISAGSVKWGDYNNDGFLDILLVGNNKAKVYKNNGNETFSEQTGIALPEFSNSSNCSAEWGDFNNDGYDDILLSGILSGSSSNITDVYKNNGDNTFSKLADTTLASNGGDAKWADLDNDGDLDIVISGNYQNIKGAIFRNNSDGTFTNMNVQIKGTAYGDLEIGDYDNDGDLDILLTGLIDGSNSIPIIYENLGDFKFNEKSIMSSGRAPTTGKWGDYNNDGKLEILYRDNILVNNGSSFSSDPKIKIDGGFWGDNIWGDVNGDGNLDIVCSGYDGSDSHMNTRFLKIYINKIKSVNTAPSAPLGLISKVSGNNVILRWNRSSDNETPKLSLSYNIALDQVAGDPNIKTFSISPKANINNGFRRIVELGNAQLDTFWILKNISKGTFSCRVQALDNAFLGSPFSTESLFSITDIPTPASSLNVSNITSTSASISWANGNGTARAVFIKLNGSNKTAYPINKTSYTGNSIFGNGSQIENEGWYCIYNGTGSTATVTGLSSQSEYKVTVSEYSGNTSSEVYSSPSGNTLKFNTLSSGVGIPAIKNNISIFPNPTKDFIVISRDNSESAQIQIINISGQVLVNQKVTELDERIDLSGLPKGIYFLKLKTGQSIDIQKIVLE